MRTTYFVLNYRISKMLFIKLCLVTVIMTVCAVNADEPKYEKSDHLCDRCSCQTHSTTLFIDCNALQMNATIADWPVAVNVTRIVAHFNRNAITRLQPLPNTSLEVIISYAHNAIAKLDSNLLTNCINVTSLDLSYNKIRSEVIVSEVFRGHYNATIYEPIMLRTLNLAHNELHTFGKNAFEHLMELRSLDISANRFRILDPQTHLSFDQLPKLEYLNLANNHLIHMNTTYFSGLMKLRILDLSYNALDFIPDTVKDLSHSLRTLRVDANPIVEITENDLLGMENLVEFSGSNLNHLNEIKPNAFRSLKNLVKVDLSGMKDTVILSDNIFGESVKELNLSNSNLEIIPPTLFNWTQLEILDLRGNQLYCTCDLHNISLQLRDVVKKDHDSAFCFDYKRYKQYEMFSLNEDICFEHDEYLMAYANTSSSERILRMTLLSTSVLLIICLVIAAWLGYVRCFRNRRYAFTTASVQYGPIGQTF